jgi:hypothetical protein
MFICEIEDDLNNKFVHSIEVIVFTISLDRCYKVNQFTG